MGERTGYEPGTFCWVECATTDTANGRAFYQALLGWEPDEQPVGDGQTYITFRQDGHQVGAMFHQPDEQRSQGVPPHWNSYVSVQDADATAARAAELGGTVMVEPFDVMDLGRMAVIGDPTTAVLGVWQPGTHFGATLVNDVGALCWNELATKDVQAARDFYAGLFGWEYDEAEGGYLMIRNGDKLNGGIRAQTEEEEASPPNWLPYFTVENADDAVRRADEAGGHPLVPPMDVGMGRIAVIADPQDATFAVFQGDTQP